MSINIKTKASIHNKFHIEVKNAETGKIEQEGFAENIVLNRMYEEIFSESAVSAASWIGIGSGDGVPSPERTSLFSQITRKSAVDVEFIYSFPVSSITKSIVLPANDVSNGKLITEVGLTSSSGRYVTHAMIKDVEGNPLSVEKTDLNIITIYATVYIELVQDENSGKLIHHWGQNSIVNRLRISSNQRRTSSNQLNKLNVILGISSYKEDLGNRTAIASTSVSPEGYEYNKVKRSAKIYGRLSPDVTADIMSLELEDTFKLDLDNINIMNPIEVLDEELGFGDGLTTTYISKRFNMKDLVVKINGSAISSYTIKNNNYKNRFLPISYLSDKLPSEIDSSWRDISYSEQRAFSSVLEVNKDKLKDLKLIRTKGNLSSSTRISYIKDDGSVGSIANTIGLTPNLPQDIKTLSGLFGRASYHLMRPLPEITFDTPPAEGDLITIDYKVPYIPKDESNVLDYSLEIQFL